MPNGILRERKEMFICSECGEGLATYQNSTEKHCENPYCSMLHTDQFDAVYISESELLARGII
jgi:hypothetical protein